MQFKNRRKYANIQNANIWMLCVFCRDLINFAGHEHEPIYILLIDCLYYFSLFYIYLFYYYFEKLQVETIVANKMRKNKLWIRIINSSIFFIPKKIFFDLPWAGMKFESEKGKNWTKKPKLWFKNHKTHDF